MSKAVVSGYGAVLSIGGPTGSTSETFTPIGEVVSVSIPDGKRSIIMTTNFDSPLGQVEKLGVALDNGQVSFSCNRISTDPGQVALIAAHYAGLGAAYDFKVVLPKDTKLVTPQTTTGDTIAFSAIISGGNGFDISTDKADVLSWTLDISGAITITPGS